MTKEEVIAILLFSVTKFQKSPLGAAASTPAPTGVSRERGRELEAPAPHREHLQYLEHTGITFVSQLA